MQRVPRGKSAPGPLTESAVRDVLVPFERRWGLKHVAPALLRHWVKTTCRRLSDPALAAYQGHNPPKDDSMRNTYDTPDVERILDEQRMEFPDGPLAVLRPPAVTITPDYAADLAAVRDYREGRTGLMDLMNRLEALKRHAVQAAPDSV